MRAVTGHKVAGNELNELQIKVLDQPGSGGANHKYLVSTEWTAPEENWSPFHTTINFQNGPILTNGINGVTQEVLLAIVADRLQSFQAGPFPCKENEAALAYVTEALEILKGRTRDRIARAVEGQLKA
jgi:hypothetical protein